MAEAEEGEATENELTEEEEDEEEEALEQITEEKQLLEESEEGEEDEGEEVGSEKPSHATMQGQPPKSAALQGKIDDDTMKQLEQIEKEAKEAADVIYELKTRVQELLQIETMTEEEEKELEQKNTELKELMELFEEKTLQIQELIANTNILETMPARLPQAKHEEDVLPRVILCGIEDDYVPKIVVCDQKNKGQGNECMPGCPGPAPPPCIPSFTAKMGETCSAPDRLAAENKDLEKIKSRLEEDISNKDRILADLQLKLATLQNEIRTVSTENAMLSEKIRKIQMNQSRPKQQPSDRSKKCPGVMAAKLQEYSDYSRRLERQLAEMEKDFNMVHKEICAAQKERDRLGQTGYMGMQSCQRSHR